MGTSQRTKPTVAWWAATLGSAGGLGSGDTAPQLPPGLQHGWLPVERRHRVDAVRKAIHALNAQRALVFMNYAARLKVRGSPAMSPGSVGSAAAMLLWGSQLGVRCCAGLTG